MPSRASCPACAAPVSARAAMCALCDHVIDPSRIAAATRAADRRSSQGLRPRGGAAAFGRQLLVFIGTLLVVVGITIAGIVAWLVRDANAIAARRATEQAGAIARLRSAWPAIDAAAMRAASPVRTAGEVDRQALRELLAGISPPANHASLGGWVAAMDADTAAWTRYGRPQLAQLASGNRPLRIVRDSLTARLDDTLRTQLASDTLSPWIGVLRRAAASPLPPAAWSHRPDVPGVLGPLAAPQLGFGAFKSMLWGNGAAALLALDAGDHAAAVRHARENVAVSQLLARTPNVLAWLLGRNQLRESAALLAHVGRLARDSVAVADAGALQRALESVGGQRYLFGPTPEARDVRAPSIIALVRDTLLPPGLRAESALQVVTGSCLSTREMLLGTSAARQVALDSAAAALTDLDPERRLRPMVVRALAEWDDATSNGGAGLEEWTQRPSWAAALARVGLGGVAGRTVGCTLL